MSSYNKELEKDTKKSTLFIINHENMDSFFIKLLEKNQLTHDVYELIYTCETKIIIIPGQFLLCDTDATNPKLRRSYSISDYRSWKIHFIIKELPNGRGGSKAICQQVIGHTMQVWWPMGHFVLPDSTHQKIVFIGTGTGFAPLYFQAKHILESSPNISAHFIFGVREERDLFYQELLREWSEKYPHFSCQFCLSQWKEEGYFQWRVTEYLKNNIKLLDRESLYSICGNPAMVNDVREILSNANIEWDHIFFEQY